MSNTDNLAITLIETAQSQKEVTANQAFSALDAAICETMTVEVVDGANAPSAADVRGATRLLLVSGSPAPSGAVTLTMPPIKRMLIITNHCGSAAEVVCDGGVQVVSVDDGTSALIYCDGNEVHAVASGGGGSSLLAINAQSGTSYTLTEDDAGALVTLDNAADIDLQVPASGDVDFPIGTRVSLAQIGDGQVSVSASGGVTIISPETTMLRAVGAQAVLTKIDTDTWLLEGDLEVRYAPPMHDPAYDTLLYLSANQSLSGWQVVQWDEEARDVLMAHSTVVNTGRITVPDGALYVRLTFFANGSSGGTGTGYIVITKNSSSEADSVASCLANTLNESGKMCQTPWLPVAPGDYYQAMSYGGTLRGPAGFGGRSYFQAEYMFAASSVAPEATPITDIPVTDGLVMWLDAAAEDTIALSSGKVTQWSDRSGNLAHMTQSTDARRPALADGPGGLKLVDFGDYGDGAWMTLPGGLNGKTFVVVVEYGVRGGGFLFGMPTSSPFHPGGLPPIGKAILSTSDSSAALRTGSASTRQSGRIVTPTSALAESGLHVVVFRSDGSMVSVQRIANDRGLSGRYGGLRLAEVAVYDRVLSDAEVEQMETHLGAKWSCANRFPASHPGRSGPALPTLPASVAPSIWHDASSAAWRWDDAGLVRELLDISDHGINALQANAWSNKMPALLGAEQNGLDAADFGAYGSGGKVLGYAASTAKTFAIVMRTGASPDRSGGHPFGDRDYADLHRGLPEDVYTAAILSGSYSASSVRTGSASTRLNGTVVDPTATGMQNGWQIIVIRSDGTSEHVGLLFNDRLNATKCGGAVLGEQMMFATVLSDSDAEIVEGYLAHKWGLTSLLPGGHPYKTTPP